MSTMKTDSRLQARFFCCHGRSPPWFRTERFFKAQGIAAVVVIGAMPAEQAVAGFFVTRNCPCIVLVDFETHLPPLSALGCRLRRRQKERPDAAPADMGGDGDGIKPSHAGARWKKHQRVAGQPAALLGDDQRGAGRSKKTAEAAPRQHIDRKDGPFERE